MLDIRSKWISKPTHLDCGLEHLVKVFKNNGYKELIIRKSIEKSQTRRKIEGINDDVLKSIKLPYMQGTTNKIANILHKNQIRVAF
jgi:hypothetical protein